MAVIESGDMVQLRAGGPPMLIEAVEAGAAQCCYYGDDRKLHKETFALEALQALKDELHAELEALLVSIERAAASSALDGVTPAHAFVAEAFDATALRAALDARISGHEAAEKRPEAGLTVIDWTLRVNSQDARARRFGDYELLEELARGGMGVVFKARHAKTGRIVALKMILAGESASADDVLRFRIETEAASRLHHPNIVPICDVGRVEGQRYFAMPLIEGENLATRLAAGPLVPCRAAELLRDISLAVQHAHERGVIHRDLKPANILLDADARPYIADFGVARRTDVSARLTRGGQILGTPCYISPEQAAGETDEIGPAADIYSLGAVLYEMLTGRPPFECHRIDVLFAQVLDGEPVAPRRLNPRIPPALETICLKCLARAPGKRYASAEDLAADLQRYLANQPIRAKAGCLAARAVARIRQKPLAAAVAALAIAVASLSVAALGWLWLTEP
ncbi:MAG TPA: serine/threonine-protein kinase [Pirellulales bacterium]|nr:serine/threonine-protein kinase [Pirellulales bacterium]